jgi:hypothetical protein
MAGYVSHAWYPRKSIMAPMPQSKIRLGKITIPNGLYPEKHELTTANVFTKLGKDVEFIAPSQTKQSRTPDVMIDGVVWEVKSPTGSSRYTIQNQFKRAAQQSQNLILDSRRVKLQSKYIEKEVIKQISLRRSIRKLKLITKNGRIIDFNK